mgnify:CR=1 FL=1
MQVSRDGEGGSGMTDKERESCTEFLHRLHSPWDVTDQEFSGFSPSECFDLGIEFAQVWECIRHGNGGAFIMHAINQDRFEALCRTYNIHFTYLTEPRLQGHYDVEVLLPLRNRAR